MSFTSTVRHIAAHRIKRSAKSEKRKIHRLGWEKLGNDIVRAILLDRVFSLLSFFFFSPRVTARPFQGVLFYRIMDRIRGVYEGGKEREYRGPAVKIVYRPFSRRIPPTAGFLLPLFKLARITHSSWNNSLEEVEFF